MSFKVTGVLKEFLPKQEGTSKAGKEWVKQDIIVSNNDGYEGAEQLYCFTLFGEEKVDNLNKFNKIGDSISIDFNISTNKWTSPKGEIKYFTSLSAWKVFKADLTLEEGAKVIDAVFEPAGDLNATEDDLPF